jgi:hypothetical protein
MIELSKGEIDQSPPEWVFENIAELSKITRSLHVLYVTVVIYCGLTILGSSDRKIVLDETTRLPVIGSDMPYAGFMLIAPLAAIFLFVYFQLHLNALVRTIADLRNRYAPLEKGRLYPWMITLVEEHEGNTIQKVERLITSLSLWWLLPTVLLLFFLLALKKPQGWRQFELLLLIAGSATVFWFWYYYELATRPRREAEGVFDAVQIFIRRHQQKILLILLVILFPSYIGPIIPKNWFTLDLHNQILINEGKENYGTYLVDLQERNLEQANLFNAVLKQANLRKAILAEANLEKANLAYSDLSSASLFRASLKDAQLQKAILDSANFQSANLQGADLQEASLHLASFQGADLRGARNLTASQLTKAANSALFGAEVDDDLKVAIQKDTERLFKCPMPIDPSSFPQPGEAQTDEQKRAQEDWQKRCADLLKTVSSNRR